MIVKSMVLSVAKCQECGNIMVYQIVNGIPSACGKCGVPANVEITAEMRKQMEQQQRPTYTVRMG
jgi:DNA-directed RNA polymerase subunit M/transcription elongation factor TFIIS